MARAATPALDPLASFQPAVQAWFRESFPAPTAAQAAAFVPIARGESTLLVAPTGSGKTLAAFLAAIDRLAFGPRSGSALPSPAPSGPSSELRSAGGPVRFGAEPDPKERLRVLYVSPLKALGVDVERNLRAPLVGIGIVADRMGAPRRPVDVAVRTGDTPARDRARFIRFPSDILITTPESLYLLLTSESAARLASVDVVILDEIHAVAGTKRGAHLALSFERLEELRRAARGASAPPLQRIGLSATARPLETVARFLGGVDAGGVPRPVAIVDAGSRRPIDVTIEVPVEDMAKLGDAPAFEEEDGSEGAGTPRSIWPSIHPRLVELIQAHRSTMIFANARRLAERLAAAINELAGDEIALAHHGSLAHDQRRGIEERLKSGQLPCIVATSSLELGIDMGAVDLVVQIESPPSVASGLQRVGRAGHAEGRVSRGVIFPKFRGDLLAAAATVARMREGLVEATTVPENPLDVLAQQIVAMASMRSWGVDELYDVIRRAAPFANLPRGPFEGVLDMLSGRYPSDEFAELRPRITWDRVGGTVVARTGAKRIAIASGGTIPDRGLYGVFLAGPPGSRPVRVGELDEEMVLESRVGEVFLLGASSWRIDEITHDRVLVTPAPGEPGKMPFWRGDKVGRPVELGLAIGQLARELAAARRTTAERRLEKELGLDARAAKNLVSYVHEQKEATTDVPSDRTVIVERFTDEVGDERVCILSTLGARVHAPWAIAILPRLREELGAEVDGLWTDDGLVFRLPAVPRPPPIESFFPEPDHVEEAVVASLGGTTVFAAHFRENAARALLLPRRMPGKRNPLWAQRKKAGDLLQVAARYESFPIVLETYRECLRDVFDLPALVDLLRRVRTRTVRIASVESRTPSPFASALVFGYVANFLYEGDTPLAERRAQALAVDHARLRELLGEAELRELLDPEAIVAEERRLQRLDGRKARTADAVHDLLLALGDLTIEEVAARAEPELHVPTAIEELLGARRIARVTIAGTARLVAMEDVGRYRDALGVVPPLGAPAAFLERVADPVGDLVSRFARTHGPFTVDALALRFGFGVATARTAVGRLIAAGKILEGGFLPGGTGVELCDAEVLRGIKRKSLARLRQQVEPVPHAALGRFLVAWHEIGASRGGLDAILAVVEQLEGCPIPATALFEDVMPARVRGFRPDQLDALCAAGEIVWRGVEAVGEGDGRIALHLVDRYGLLAPPPEKPEDGLALRVAEVLAARGAIFFGDVVSALGAFPGDVLAALWDLVWRGAVTNDTTAPLRSRAGLGPAVSTSRRNAFRSRRIGPPGSEGRWSLLPGAARALGLDTPIAGAAAPSETDRRAALAAALLERYGVVTREVAHTEGIVGGFSAVYDVLKAMEEAGRARRGWFVADLGAAQFARPASEDRLRALREPPEEVQVVVLAATDPANPYGAALPWPPSETRPQRAAGALVVIASGELVGWIGRGEKSLLTFLPAEEPERRAAAVALAEGLAAFVDTGRRQALNLERIDGNDATAWPLAVVFTEAGWQSTSKGLLKRREGVFASRRRR